MTKRLPHRRQAFFVFFNMVARKKLAPLIAQLSTFS